MRTVKIETHDRQTFLTVVEEYDPVAIAAEIDNADKLVIVIGDVILSRISVKSVSPSVGEEDGAI